MSNITSVLFSGVGGQGVILASELISEVAMLHGLDVKKAEVHGMAQRGGSVTSHVKFGEKIFSPIIENKSADIIAAFEPIEALRYINFLSEKGTIFVNTKKYLPITAVLEKSPYPENPIAMLGEYAKNIVTFDAFELAEKAGTFRATNVVLLGAISNLLPFSMEEWKKGMEVKVKPKFLDINMNAFNLGKEEAKKVMEGIKSA